MPRNRQRACLESGFKLDINLLIRRGWISPGFSSGPFVYGWTNTYMRGGEGEFSLRRG